MSADYPLWIGSTVPQVDGKCETGQIIAPDGTDIFTGYQVFPTGLTTQQIFAKCKPVTIVDTSGNTLI